MRVVSAPMHVVIGSRFYEEQWRERKREWDLNPYGACSHRQGTARAPGFNSTFGSLANVVPIHPRTMRNTEEKLLVDC